MPKLNFKVNFLFPRSFFKQTIFFAKKLMQKIANYLQYANKKNCDFCEKKPETLFEVTNKVYGLGKAASTHDTINTTAVE